MEVLRIKRTKKQYVVGSDVLINCSNIMSIVLRKPVDEFDPCVAYVYVGVSDSFAGEKNGIHSYVIFDDSIVSTNSPIVASILGEYIKVQPIKQY